MATHHFGLGPAPGTPADGESTPDVFSPGRAAEADPPARGEAADAWWSDQPPGKAAVFQLRIGLALFVEWDMERGLMTVHRWSPRDDYSRAVRTYP